MVCRALPVRSRILVVLFAVLLPATVHAGPSLSVVIVYPGGPGLQGGGQKLIDQFVERLVADTGISASAVVGAYFNELSPAL